jgi:hypothetical protein
MLLDAGHDLNAVNADGLTPLHIAIQMEYAEIVSLLADKTKVKNSTVPSPGIAPAPVITNAVPVEKKKYFDETEILPGRLINYDIGEGFAVTLHIVVTIILIRIGLYFGLFFGAGLLGQLIGIPSSVTLQDFVFTVVVMLLGICCLVFGLRQLKHWDRWWISFWGRIVLICAILYVVLFVIVVLLNLVVP